MTALAERGSFPVYGRIDVPTAGREGKRLYEIAVQAFREIRGETAAGKLAFSRVQALAQEHGANVDSSAKFRLANRLLLALPSDIPAPELDLDSDGDVLFDWMGPDRQMATIALREDGCLNFAARLSNTVSRSGKDLFIDSISPEIVGLLRESLRHR